MRTKIISISRRNGSVMDSETSFPEEKTAGRADGSHV